MTTISQREQACAGDSFRDRSRSDSFAFSKILTCSSLTLVTGTWQIYRLRPERMAATGFTMRNQHGSHAEVSDGAEVEVEVSLVKESTGSGLGPVPWLSNELHLTVLHISTKQSR